MNQMRRGTPDFLLLLVIIILVCFGLVMVFSSSSVIAVSSAKYGYDKFHFTKKQAVWVLLGIFVMFLTMNIHFNRYKKWYIPFFAATIIMLLIVAIRPAFNGARSLFIYGTIGIQPSELAKLGIILYLASLISKKGLKFQNFKKGLLPVLLVVGLVCFLIMMQPDLGSTILFITCALTVIFAGGAKMKHLLITGGLTLLVGLAGVGGYLFSKQSATAAGELTDSNFRVARFECFLDPWKDQLDDCFQLVHSLYSFGHGNITGAGFGQSIEKIHYLPEAYNDFIFAIVGEELGFIGSTIVLLLFLILIWRGIIVSLRCPDTFGTLVGIGIVGMIGFQVFINIGGVTGTIPMTGVTLPFISYGGSSLLVILFSMGILLNISRYSNLPHTKKTSSSTKQQQASRS